VRREYLRVEVNFAVWLDPVRKDQGSHHYVYDDKVSAS